MYIRGALLRRGYFREDKTKGIEKIRGTFRPERFDWRTTTSRSFLRRIRIFFFGFLSSLQTTRYVDTHANTRTRTYTHDYTLSPLDRPYASSLSFSRSFSHFLSLSHSPRASRTIFLDVSTIELNNTAGSKIFSWFRYRHLHTDRYAPPLPSLISRRDGETQTFSLRFLSVSFFFFFFFSDSKRDAR